MHMCGLSSCYMCFPEQGNQIHFCLVLATVPLKRASHLDLFKCCVYMAAASVVQTLTSPTPSTPVWTTMHSTIPGPVKKIAHDGVGVRFPCPCQGFLEPSLSSECTCIQRRFKVFCQHFCVLGLLLAQHLAYTRCIDH